VFDALDDGVFAKYSQFKIINEMKLPFLDGQSNGTTQIHGWCLWYNTFISFCRRDMQLWMHDGNIKGRQIYGYTLKISTYPMRKHRLLFNKKRTVCTQSAGKPLQLRCT